MKTFTTLVLLIGTLSIHAQWTSTELSIARSNTSAARIGDKLFFVGGNASGDEFEVARKRVDIYDVADNTWDVTNSSVLRQYTFTETIGNKLYVAGYTQTFESDQDVIEIYDSESKEWSTMEFPFNYGATSFTTMGDLLIGVKGGSVDIYDTVKEEWTSHTLSKNRILAKAQGCSGKVYFAGGGSYVQGLYNTVDIYDVSTNSWIIDTLTEAKNGIASACVNEKVYYIGGGLGFSEESSKIEIFNTSDNTKEIVEVVGLDIKNDVAITDDYLYVGVDLLEDDDFAIARRLNLETYENDSIFIPTSRVSVGMIAHGQSVYFAGGFTPAFERTSVVEIFSELPSSLLENSNEVQWTIYPNPAASFINLESVNSSMTYQIYNELGQQLAIGETTGQINVNNLKQGVYFLKIDQKVLSFAKL